MKIKILTLVAFTLIAVSHSGDAQSASILYRSNFGQIGNTLNPATSNSEGRFNDFSNPPTGGTVTGPNGFSEDLYPLYPGGETLFTDLLAVDAFEGGSTYTFSIDGGGSYDVLAEGSTLFPTPLQFTNWQEIAQWDGSYPLEIEWTPITDTGDLLFSLNIEKSDFSTGVGLETTDTSYTLTENPFGGEEFTDFTLGLSIVRFGTGNRAETVTSMDFSVVPEPTTISMVFGVIAALALSRFFRLRSQK